MTPKYIVTFKDQSTAKFSECLTTGGAAFTLMSAEDEVELHLPSPQRPLSPPIIRLEDASTGYNGRAILKRLDLFIADDDRIGLLGANGNGKSTLVKLLCGRIPLMSGEMQRHKKLSTAYFAQHQLEELSPRDTPYSLVRAKLPQAFESTVRARTHQLGFGVQLADTPIEKLSGGEKARLLLGLAAFDGPHLMLLDEPTNHLDIEARAALVEAISEYTGAIIIVSHDRFLLEAVCDRLWLVADGGVSPFDGDLDDYTRLVLSGGAPAEKRGAPAKAEAPAPRGGQTSRPKPEKRLAEIEARMVKLNDLIARVDRTLAAADTFRDDPGKAGKLAAGRGALAENLARLEDEWLRLSGELSAA